MSLEANKTQPDAPPAESGLRRLSEKMRLKLHVIYRTYQLETGASPPTARGAEEYREGLFPEIKSVDDVVTRFKGKCIADIGSGDTYLMPESLINRVASENDPKTLFIGIDPNAGYLEWLLKGGDTMDPPNMPGLDKSKITEPGPGKKFTIRGSLPGTALPRKGVDLFISNYAIGYWVVRQKPLLAIFEAMEEALTDDGEIRFNPVRRTLFEQDNELGQFIKQNFVTEFHGVPQSHGGRTGLMIFRRKR